MIKQLVLYLREAMNRRELLKGMASIAVAPKDLASVAKTGNPFEAHDHVLKALGANWSLTQHIGFPRPNTAEAYGFFHPDLRHVFYENLGKVLKTKRVGEEAAFHAYDVVSNTMPEHLHRANEEFAAELADRIPQFLRNNPSQIRNAGAFLHPHIGVHMKPEVSKHLFDNLPDEQFDRLLDHHSNYLDDMLDTEDYQEGYQKHMLQKYDKYLGYEADYKSEFKNPVEKQRFGRVQPLQLPSGQTIQYRKRR